MTTPFTVFVRFRLPTQIVLLTGIVAQAFGTVSVAVIVPDPL